MRSQASPVFATPAAQVEHAASTVQRLPREIARAVRALVAEHRAKPQSTTDREAIMLRREARHQASLLHADTLRDRVLLGRPL